MVLGPAVDKTTSEDIVGNAPRNDIATKSHLPRDGGGRIEEVMRVGGGGLRLMETT